MHETYTQPHKAPKNYRTIFNSNDMILLNEWDCLIRSTSQPFYIFYMWYWLAIKSVNYATGAAKGIQFWLVDWQFECARLFRFYTLLN